MTTITHEQFEAACSISNVPEAALRTALWDLGITIAPPEPPKAMVKLARDAVIAAAPIGDWDTWQDGYVAALQHAVQVVREERSSRDGTVCHGTVHGVCNNILIKLGSTA